MTYTYTKIAEHMIDAGYAKDFITIALQMLDNPYCDLNGRVGGYANDMLALKERALNEMGD